VSISKSKKYKKGDSENMERIGIDQPCQQSVQNMLISMFEKMSENNQKLLEKMSENSKKLSEVQTSSRNLEKKMSEWQNNLKITLSDRQKHLFGQSCGLKEGKSGNSESEEEVEICSKGSIARQGESEGYNSETAERYNKENPQKYDEEIVDKELGHSSQITGAECDPIIRSIGSYRESTINDDILMKEYEAMRNESYLTLPSQRTDGLQQITDSRKLQMTELATQIEKNDNLNNVQEEEKLSRKIIGVEIKTNNKLEKLADDMDGEVNDMIPEVQVENDNCNEEILKRQGEKAAQLNFNNTDIHSESPEEIDRSPIMENIWIQDKHSSIQSSPTNYGIINERTNERTGDCKNIDLFKKIGYANTQARALWADKITQEKTSNCKKYACNVITVITDVTVHEKDRGINNDKVKRYKKCRKLEWCINVRKKNNMYK
jgi:hypothetical protein